MATSGIPPPRHGEPTASPTERSIVTPSGLNIITYVGDIFTVSGADGIVTGEGVSFEHNSFITQTLIERLDDFESKRRKLQREKGPFKLWIVRTTQLNGANDFRVVFHAMLEQGSSDKWVKNMEQLYKEVFRKAEKYQVKTLILPVLGTGRANANVGDAVCAIVTAVIRCQNTMCLQKVYLTTRDKTIAEMMSTQFQYQFSPLSKENVKLKRSKSIMGCTSSKTSDSFKIKNPPQKRPRRRSEPNEEYDKNNGFNQEQRQSGQAMRPESVGRNDNYYRRNSGRSLEAGEHDPTRRNVDEPAIRDRGNEAREHGSRFRSGTFPKRHESKDKEQEYSSYRLANRERAPLHEDMYTSADIPRREHSNADTYRNGPARSEDVTIKANVTRREHSNADTYRNGPARSEDVTIKANVTRREHSNADTYRNGPARSEGVTTKANVTRREYNGMSIEVEHGQSVVETSKKERNVPEFNHKQRYEAITGKSSDPYSRHDTNEGFDVRHVTKVNTNRSTAQTNAVPDLEHRKGTKLNSSAAAAAAATVDAVDASDATDDDDDSHNNEDDAVHAVHAAAAAATATAATGGRDGNSPGKKFDGQNCPICISPMTDPKVLDKCGHVFCRDCIDNSFKHFKPVCPSCNMVYGILTGNQPDGTMDVDFSGHVLPGYKDCGMITVTYHFPDGIQGPNHPQPGQPFDGTARRGFLPDCREGKDVLSLLRIAFDRKLTFTIGRSTTTGKDNVVTWNDIHHKTRVDGGATNYGYPDPDYLARVKGELASKGVTEESTIKQDTTF